MIVLSGGGPNFGLPETSPYVTKTEVQLKMAGLSYRKEFAQPQSGPKGQIPFIEDGGRLVGDSTFIRFHVEQEYGIDLDAGLSTVERATALAFELMCDHELTPAVTYFRWMVPANFAKGPAKFFAGAPEAFKAQIMERVKQNFIARGIGRHSEAEIVALGVRSLKALSVYLGEKAFMAGDEPHGADALIFATLAAAMSPYFDSPLRNEAIRFPNLVGYVVRMMDRFYPEFEWDAGIEVAAKAA